MSNKLKLKIHNGMLVKDVAKFLGIHPESLRRLARQGKITPTFIGNTIVFERADIEAFKKIYNPTKGSGKIAKEQ